MRILGLALCFLLSVAVLAPTQQPPPAVAGTAEHTVYVTIADKQGKPVGAVDASKYEVSYGDSRWTPDIRSAAEVPLDFAVVVDASKSMADKWEFEKKAVLQVFHAARANSGRGFLVVFNQQVGVTEYLQEGEVGESLGKIFPRDGSAVYDAILAACAKLGSERNAGRHRAIFLISDGDDNMSHHTKDAAIRAAQRDHITVFSIGLLSSEPRPGMVQSAGSVLREVSKKTGGPTLLLDQPSDLAGPLADLLKTQYEVLLDRGSTTPEKVQRLQLKTSDKNISIAAPAAF